MIKLGPRIAQGRTAEIYACGDHQILKLFWADWPATDVAFEADINRRVRAAGLNVPAVFDLITMNGRQGITDERVARPSMLQSLLSKPWLMVRYARLLAELHAEMHERHVPGLPSQRLRLERRIQTATALPLELKEIVLQHLQRLPDNDGLCHGDFHPDNVLLSPRGPIIIDWVDVTLGNPLADVARTSLLLRIGQPPLGMVKRWLINALRNGFHTIYLRHYTQLRSVTWQQIEAWIAPVAAARLSEGIHSERPQLLELLRGALKGILVESFD